MGKKRQTILAILLLLSLTTFFLPWFRTEVSFDGETRTETTYGYYYVVPLVTPYAMPVGALCVIGFILSVISFKQRQRFDMLNVMAGIFILAGAIGAFIYTISVASGGVPIGKMSWSVNVQGNYGMGLMFLFGLLITIVGASKKLYVVLRELFVEVKQESARHFQHSLRCRLPHQRRSVRLTNGVKATLHFSNILCSFDADYSNSLIAQCSLRIKET